MPERDRTHSVGSEVGFDEADHTSISTALRNRFGNKKDKYDDEQQSDAQRQRSINSHKKMNFFYRRMFHREANFKKLATYEDPYHLHKGMGILSVCSFIYRYGYCYNTTGTLGFDGDKENRFDWLTMIIHLTLALSSILFRVPKKRLPDKPLVIYEEYRQHAQVFTLRCFNLYTVCILWDDISPYLFDGQVIERPLWIAPVVVMLHHILADIITWRHGNGSTAVRASSDHLLSARGGKDQSDAELEKQRQNSKFYKNVAKAYSFYQFLAIASHILPNDRILDLAWNAIIAIASSAFMMTLYRKRIIRALTHMFMYSFCLGLSTFHIIRLIGWWASFLTLCTFLLRINLPRSLPNAIKYVLWTGFYFAFMADPTGAKTWTTIITHVPVVPTLVDSVGTMITTHMQTLGLGFLL